MPRPSRTLALKPRWVIPVVSPPLEGSTMIIDADQILDVGPQGEADRSVELDDWAILPGFVNCHTHLEFSELQKPLGGKGGPFTDWVRAVLDDRRQRPERAAEGAIAAGIAELRACGTSLVGEIATAACWPRALTTDHVPLTGVRFFELIGNTPARRAEARQAARQFMDAGPQGSWQPGLSPHAPYTVAMELLDFVVEFAKSQRLPVAMHLAETRDELQLIREQTGPLRDLLDELGAWDREAIPAATSLCDYLERLATAPRSLIIHGNYLDERSIQLMASCSNSMSVIYCPRTHDYFGHTPYPLAKFLAAGVHVALGTDSRASNPSLSVWEEACFVATHHPNVDPATVLELATTNGAHALGLGNRYGGIARGMSTQLCAVRMHGDERDPVAAILHRGVPPIPLQDLLRSEDATDEMR